MNNFFIDERDGVKYKTIRIVGKTWMAENLVFKTKEGSFLYGNNKYYTDYGRLYTWDAAMESCPNGWTIPSDEDWVSLFMHFGGYRDKLIKNIFKSKRIGIDLKGTYDALTNFGSSGFDVELCGDGFNALEGYGKIDEIETYNRGCKTAFWSCSFHKKIENKIYFEFGNNNEIHRKSISKHWTRYCRCVKIE